MDKLSLPDTHQNFWHLTSIQASAQGLIAIVLGWSLAKEYGPGTAILSICIGNLILWLIGLSVISMTYQTRSHAIENVRTYLGKSASFAAAIILILALFMWYVIQINVTVSSMDFFFRSILEKPEQIISIREGAALGLFVALLAMGGIRLIRWICTLTFPFMILFILWQIISSTQSVSFTGTWRLSAFAAVPSIALFLPGFVNLPTFFRHSRSRADSFLALTLITVFDIFFSVSSIFIPMTEISSANQSLSISYFLNIQSPFLIIFIIIMYISINLVNIYYASAGCEFIFYRNWGAKEYTIIGLLGTATYAFLQTLVPMKFIENLTNSCISSLGVALLMAFLTRIIVQHRPRPLEKTITSLCWGIGCITSLVTLIANPNASIPSLLYGVVASILSFLCIIFVEETLWSAEKIVKKMFSDSGDS